MPTSCAAYGCTKRSSKNSADKVLFHRVPAHPEKRAAWVRAIRRDNWIPSSASRVCSSHFTPDCYQESKGGRHMLKDDAVPSIFPALPKHLQPKLFFSRKYLGISLLPPSEPKKKVIKPSADDTSLTSLTFDAPSTTSTIGSFSANSNFDLSSSVSCAVPGLLLKCSLPKTSMACSSNLLNDSNQQLSISSALDEEPRSSSFLHRSDQQPSSNPPLAHNGYLSDPSLPTQGKQDSVSTSSFHDKQSTVPHFSIQSENFGNEITIEFPDNEVSILDECCENSTVQRPINLKHNFHDYFSSFRSESMRKNKGIKAKKKTAREKMTVPNAADTPKTAKLKEIIRVKNRKIKTLQMRCNRQEKKITDLNSVIETLRNDFVGFDKVKLVKSQGGSNRELSERQLSKLKIKKVRKKIW